MGKPTGFLEVERRDRKYAPVAERVQHFKEFVEEPGPEAVAKQASREPLIPNHPHCMHVIAPEPPGRG